MTQETFTLLFLCAVSVLWLHALGIPVAVAALIIVVSVIVDWVVYQSL